MVTIKQIQKEMGFRVCIPCLNKRYHVHLTEDDCRWAGFYPQMCYQCHMLTDDIIIGFNWKGKLKLLFKS
ncbi:MAG: hypothetical protein IKO68_02225 [Oscillospiraceae bacterium]|nr:hypothetical protein [Oscillospiraceae bacterium]